VHSRNRNSPCGRGGLAIWVEEEKGPGEGEGAEGAEGAERGRRRREDHQICAACRPKSSTVAVAHTLSGVVAVAVQRTHAGWSPSSLFGLRQDRQLGQDSSRTSKNCPRNTAFLEAPSAVDSDRHPRPALPIPVSLSLSAIVSFSFASTPSLWFSCSSIPSFP